MPFFRILLVLLAMAAFTTASAADTSRPALASAIHQKIARCWSVPADLPEHVVPVRVKFSLTQAGELDGSPMIDGPVSGDPATKAFAAGAIRAVVRCAPFSGLAGLAPYEAWKTIVVTFRRPEL